MTAALKLKSEFLKETSWTYLGRFVEELWLAKHCQELKGLQNETHAGVMIATLRIRAMKKVLIIGERSSDPRIVIDCLHWKQYGTDG